MNATMRQKGDSLFPRAAFKNHDFMFFKLYIYRRRNSTWWLIFYIKCEPSKPASDRFPPGRGVAREFDINPRWKPADDRLDLALINRVRGASTSTICPEYMLDISPRIWSRDNVTLSLRIRFYVDARPKEIPTEAGCDRKAVFLVRRVMRL